MYINKNNQGFTLIELPYTQMIFVAKSKNGDFLCIDTASGSNKIYKIQATVGNSGLGVTGCADLE